MRDCLIHSSCLPCDEVGSAAPTPCPYGWYQDLKAQMACKICPEGYFCQDSTVAPTSKCHAGYYCPKGSYTGYENPCPLGTYNNVEGAKAISECLPCPIGKYCGSRGLAHPTGECFAVSFPLVVAYLKLERHWQSLVRRA